jgi:hypothetical protein
MMGLLRVSSSAHGAEITSWGGFGGRRPNLIISVALQMKDVVLLGGLSGGKGLGGPGILGRVLKVEQNVLFDG